MITSSSHYKAVAAPRNANVFPWPTSGFTAAEAVMGEGTKQTTLTRRQKTPGNRLPGKCTSNILNGEFQDPKMEVPTIYKAYIRILKFPLISINIHFLSMIFPTCRGSIASSSAMSLCSSGQAKQVGTTNPGCVLHSVRHFLSSPMRGPKFCWKQYATMVLITVLSRFYWRPKWRTS